MPVHRRGRIILKIHFCSAKKIITKTTLLFYISLFLFLFLFFHVHFKTLFQPNPPYRTGPHTGQAVYQPVFP